MYSTLLIYFYLQSSKLRFMRLPARALARSTICETMREPMHARTLAPRVLSNLARVWLVALTFKC